MIANANTGKPNGVKLKKRKPSSPRRTNSLLTTRLGAVATNVIMPLIKAAKLSGIINRLGGVLVWCEIRIVTGMKIAVTAVELIVEPSPQTTDISNTTNRRSLFAAVRVSQSPKARATPVRTKPSPMTNRAAIKTILGSLKPANASVIVNTPVNGSNVSMISATASMRGLLMANITIAAISNASTDANSGFICAHHFNEWLTKRRERRSIRLW